MLKKCFLLLIFISFYASAGANTVELRLDENFDAKISSLQLFFEDSDLYGFPVEWDSVALEMDFFSEFGTGQVQKRRWEFASPFYSDGDIDYATGIGAFASIVNSKFALSSGLIVTLTSEDTLFKINLDDPKNAIYDFSGEDGELIEFSLKEVWQGDTQIVTVGAVPIPSTFLLLGGGIVALVGGTRRKIGGK